MAGAGEPLLFLRKKPGVQRQHRTNRHTGMRFHSTQPGRRLRLSPDRVYNRAEQGNRRLGVPPAEDNPGQLPQVSADNILFTAKAQRNPAHQTDGFYGNQS